MLGHYPVIKVTTYESLSFVCVNLESNSLEKNKCLKSTLGNYAVDVNSPMASHFQRPRPWPKQVQFIM